MTFFLTSNLSTFHLFQQQFLCLPSADVFIVPSAEKDRMIWPKLVIQRANEDLHRHILRPKCAERGKVNSLKSLKVLAVFLSYKRAWHKARVSVSGVKETKRSPWKLSLKNIHTHKTAVASWWSPTPCHPAQSTSLSGSCWSADTPGLSEEANHRLSAVCSLAERWPSDLLNHSAPSAQEKTS